MASHITEWMIKSLQRPTWSDVICCSCYHSPLAQHSPLYGPPYCSLNTPGKSHFRALAFAVLFIGTFFPQMSAWFTFSCPSRFSQRPLSGWGLPWPLFTLWPSHTWLSLSLDQCFSTGLVTFFLVHILLICCIYFLSPLSSLGHKLHSSFYLFTSVSPEPRIMPGWVGIQKIFVERKNEQINKKFSINIC